MRIIALSLLLVSMVRFSIARADSPVSTTFLVAPKPLIPGAVTTDWPCLLGPTHNEVCTETHLLKQFPPGGPTLVWEAGKGEGYASPVVAGNRLVLFHRVANQERIDCLDATTGKANWSYAYPTEYTDDWGYTNGPRSSPAIGGDALFAIGAEGKLHCLDLATGKLRWQHDLMDEYKLAKGFFGVGASPLVEGDQLIVNVGAKGGPCVVAFDVHTGKTVWSAGTQWGPSYATPVPATIHGKRRVLVFAGGKSSPPTGGLLCIDPANGKLDFEFPWRGTRRESVNASSPVVIGNDVFISECYGSGGTLLEITDDFKPKVLWTNPNFRTHFMSAIEKDGYLYGVDGHGPDDAFLVCVELKTGKEVWRTQPEWNESVDTPDGPRQIPTGTYRCWLMPADGHYLILGEFGHLLWADLTPKGFKELQRAWLFAADETWTPPAISKGLLYVSQNGRDAIHRTGPRVLCYDLRAS
jgi:outer membrane protein assembly factor BamB